MNVLLTSVTCGEHLNIVNINVKIAAPSALSQTEGG